MLSGGRKQDVTRSSVAKRSITVAFSETANVLASTAAKSHQGAANDTGDPRPGEPWFCWATRDEGTGGTANSFCRVRAVRIAN